MDNTELRIGNWVKYAGTITPVQIEAGSFINVENKVEAFDPIELTPSILEQCGFAKPQNEDELYFIKGDCADVFFYNDENGFECHVGNELTYNHIKHLHQLQNLYFSLTGEELKINL